MRLFNEDLEIFDVFTERATQYYDKFHIGILTAAGRLDCADSLLRRLVSLELDIPIDIVINLMLPLDEIPSWWKDNHFNIHILNELKSIVYVRNFLFTLYSDRPYIITFDDDAILNTNNNPIDNLIWAHIKYKVDMVRGLYNGCCISTFKGLIPEIGWYDERFIFYNEDTDFHMRLERYRYKLGLEHNKVRFHEGLVVNHIHSPVNNFENLDIDDWDGKKHLKAKWGLDRQPINEKQNIEAQQLLPDIDYYPELTTKYQKLERIH